MKGGDYQRTGIGDLQYYISLEVNNMRTNLKEKLADINTSNTNASAIFKYDDHGVNNSITKDTTVYELALLGIEVQKEILRRCVEQEMEASEAFGIIKGMTEICINDLMKEQLMKLLCDDDVIEKLLSK